MSNAIVCDILVDMNTADANGTTLTTSILNSGTQGVNSGWAFALSAPAGLTIDSHQNDRLSQVYLRGSGTNYASNATARRFVQDAGQQLQQADLSWTARSPAASCAAWVTIGPHDISPGGSLFNLLGLTNSLGHYAAAQLKNGSTYGISIETDPAGTSHSAYNTSVTPGSTYWITLKVDFTVGVSLASMSIYDTSGTQVGSTVTVATHTTLSNVAKLSVGNNESTTDSGHTITWEHMMVDYTHAAFPLGPSGATTYFVPRTGTGGATGSSTTATVQIAGVSVGDLVVVQLKFEGTTTTVTCADGSSNALTKATSSVANNGGSNGEPHDALFWYVSPVAGTITYTFTLTAAKTFRDTRGIALAPPATVTGFSLDGTATSNSATSGTAVTSGNITTTGTLGVAFGSYAEFGASLTNMLINAGFPDAWVYGGSGNSVLWCAIYQAGFTGGAAATMSSSNRWTSEILALKATTSTTITIDMWGAVQTTPMARRLRGVVPSGTVGIKA